MVNQFFGLQAAAYPPFTSSQILLDLKPLPLKIQRL